MDSKWDKCHLNEWQFCGRFYCCLFFVVLRNAPNLFSSLVPLRNFFATQTKLKLWALHAIPIQIMCINTQKLTESGDRDIGSYTDTPKHIAEIPFVFVFLLLIGNFRCQNDKKITAGNEWTNDDRVCAQNAHIYTNTHFDAKSIDNQKLFWCSPIENGLKWMNGTRTLPTEKIKTGEVIEANDWTPVARVAFCHSWFVCRQKSHSSIICGV